MSTSTPTPSTPAPELSLTHQRVLEEDEYTAALSHIIARDFFPSLVHLDATNDYLNALRSQDPRLISASVRGIEELNTPGPSTRRSMRYETPMETPYGRGPSDTPFHASDTEERPSKRPRFNADLSLDQFQARYTSEDNSSFTQILDDENRLRKEKYGWAWEAQKRVEKERERMLEARERMMIEGAPAAGVREKFRIEAPKSAGLLTDGKAEEDGEKDGEGDDEGEAKDDEEGKQLVLKESEEVEDVMASKKDKRPAGVHGWRFKARNALMFAPDADVSPYNPPNKQDIEEKKTISHSNTRVQEEEHTTSGEVSGPPSPTRSRIDAAITGTPYRPRRNSFSLVPDLPSPTPSQLGPTAVKQLMTWGTLDATPRIISSDDSEEPLPPPSTTFHISEPSSRERLSHKLSNNAAKSLRAKAGLLGNKTPGISRTPGGPGKGSMGPPSWTPRRSDAGNLTPAAKRLLNRTTMGAAASRRAEAMERSAGWDSGRSKEKDLNRVRWTPTPSLGHR